MTAFVGVAHDEGYCVKRAGAATVHLSPIFMGDHAARHPIGRHPKGDVSRAVSSPYRALYQGCIAIHVARAEGTFAGFEAS
jgi:hypothetical protein